jgi:cysteine desulfuration protein SufE
MSAPTTSIDDTLAELAEDFDLLGGWEEQLEYVLDLGKGLPPLPDSDKTEANRVQGCASRVWLVTDPQADGTVQFRAESDGHISRGNVALLLKLYSGHTPADILAFDAKAGLDRLGLPAVLTPQRSNGLFSMVGRIRRDAAALAGH